MSKMIKTIKLGYISLANYVQTTNLSDSKDKGKPNEIVLEPNKSYILTIDDPLTMPFTTKLKTSSKGLTRRQIVNFIVNCYRDIYEEENKTSSIKEALGKDVGQFPAFNRIYINGKYGIWDHVIEELMLHTLYINGNKLTVGVNSEPHSRKKLILN